MSIEQNHQVSQATLEAIRDQNTPQCEIVETFAGHRLKIFHAVSGMTIFSRTYETRAEADTGLIIWLYDVRPISLR